MTTMPAVRPGDAAPIARLRRTVVTMATRTPVTPGQQPHGGLCAVVIGDLLWLLEHIDSLQPLPATTEEPQ